MSRLKELLDGLPRLEGSHNYDPQESGNCSIFPQFRAFPNELRCKVWDMASHHLRYVKLFLHNGEHESSGDTSEVNGQSRIPVVLQVNRESRNEGLRHYLRIYERPRYEKIESSEASEEVWYRNYNDLRMDRPAVETRAIRPNMLYINFSADQFLQHPMKGRIEKV